MIDVSIIIVNYNVKEFLLNLLDSLKKASANINTEIIIVDNNSTDGSIEVINRKYPSVITIQNKKNVGFGAANNQALEIAKGEYLLLINPDTLVKENTLTEMIKFMEENPQVGIAGCKVLNPDGTLQLACRRSFPTPWVSLTKVMGLSKAFPKSKLFAKYNLTYLDENQSNEVDAISGSFMFMRKNVYDKVGGFDTDFFMYGEDLDLCYRVQKSGFKVYYVNDTEIIHYKGESTKRSKIDETKIFYNAMHLFVSKHFSSSFIVEAILQLGIFIRKVIAFANVNRFILIAILLDFISFFFLIKFSENIYATPKWPGFPKVFIPWVYIVPSIFQIIVSAFLGAYKRNSISVLKSIISLFVGFILITSVTFFFKQFAFSRAVVLLTYLFSIVLFSLWRIVFKLFLLKKDDYRNIPQNAVLVGIDNKAIDLANKLKNNINSGINLIGLISLDLKDIGADIENHKIIGSTGNLKKLLADNKITKVIFSSDSIELKQVFATVAECQGENVEFLMSGNELDYMVGKSTIAQIDKIPLLKVRYNISELTHRIIKRTFDIVFSLIGLLFIYPFVFLYSIFKKNKSEFVKAVLQLPKVFIGKMSFVGPKEKLTDTNLYLGKIGITGLWFTEIFNSSDSEEVKRQNLFYAKNQNIWLDLEVLGKTFAKYFLTRKNNG